MMAPHTFRLLLALSALTLLAGGVLRFLLYRFLGNFFPAHMLLVAALLAAAAGLGW